MQDRVLIDTSIWVDFFRGKDAGLAEKISALLKSGMAVYCGIIALELIKGAKGQRELQVLQDAFDAMEKASETEDTYFYAGRLGYEMARKGHSMGVVDLLIAQVAIENDLSLLTADGHFGTIAKNSRLKLLT